MLWMSSLHVARSACYTGETTRSWHTRQHLPFLLSAAAEGMLVRRALLPLVLAAHADVDEELRSHAFQCAATISHLHLPGEQYARNAPDESL